MLPPDPTSWRDRISKATSAYEYYEEAQLQYDKRKAVWDAIPSSHFKVRNPDLARKTQRMIAMKGGKIDADECSISTAEGSDEVNAE